MLTGRKILLGISGSIAAYKTIILVRLLIKKGAEVKVILTPAAKDFVSPLVLSTLSKNEILTEISNDNAWANHVMLGRWADLMIIVPASCNTIANMATGICDNLLLAVYLSATCPVWVAPAMDEDMWKHPATKKNIATLLSFGNYIMKVGTGELASGLNGEGRMAEPEEILEEIKRHFGADNPLKGTKVLVTAGPTYEPLDPVRFIGNHSSGKMGIELANALYQAGAQTTLILGPSSIEIPTGINLVRVKTAAEMFDVCKKLFTETDITVMSAAVADYRPKKAATEKIKKEKESLTVELVQTVDILKYCGSIKKENQLLVGFALETANEEENAQKKLVNKNADIIVLNSLNDDQAGFGTNTNKVTIFEKNGDVHRMPLQSKKEVAQNITDLIIKRWHEHKK